MAGCGSAAHSTVRDLHMRNVWIKTFGVVGDLQDLCLHSSVFIKFIRKVDLLLKSNIIFPNQTTICYGKRKKNVRNLTVYLSNCLKNEPFILTYLVDCQHWIRLKVSRVYLPKKSLL